MVIIKNNKKTLLAVIVSTIVVLLALNASIGLVQASSPPDASVDQTNPVAQETPPGPPPLPTPLPQVNTYQDTAQVSLQDIGIASFTMDIPSVVTLPFDLPNQWVITSDSASTYFDLHYDFFYDMDAFIGDTGEEDRYTSLPTVNVYVDDFLAKSFTPIPGKDQHEIIQFPFEALREQNTYYTANEHNIRLELQELDAELCLFIGLLQVHQDSTINVGFLTRPAAISLADFPRPLIQESLFPETLLVILPDEFEEADLAAAATVVNALGKNTFGNINFNAITASQANESTLAQSSAISIGTPDKNSFTKQLYETGYLPTSLLDNGEIVKFGTGGQAVIPADNGIVQMVPSNINNVYNFLVVTGLDDDALMTAANGLANLPLIGFTGSLAVIEPNLVADVMAEEEKEISPDDIINSVYQLADLGNVQVLPDVLLIGRGRTQETIDFFIPLDWDIQKDAQLVLTYEYSTTLSLKNSSMSIYINGNPVGNAPLDANVQGKKDIVIPLDKNVFAPGRVNTITFDGVLAQELECANWDPNSYWINIRNSSLLYLPHKIITEANKLPKYYHPFEHLAFESDLLFVMPPSPSQAELNGLLNLNFRIALYQRPDKTINYQAAFGSPDLDMDSHKNYHVVLYGKPTNNPLIQVVNDYLPLQFVPGEDTLMQEGGDVLLRLPSETNVGIVEVINSPWNPRSSLTVISGTSDEGLKWATEMIGKLNLPIDWYGDIFFINENMVQGYLSNILAIRSLDDIVSEVTQEDLGLEIIDATITPAVTAPPAAAPDTDFYTAETSTTQTPEAISLRTMGLIVLAIIALIILVLAGIRASRGGRKL